MLLPASDTVFMKTAKGQTEIACRTHGLNARQRRIMIVVDGKKSVGALLAMFPAEEVAKIVPFLAGQGFITDAAEHTTALSSTPAEPPDEGLREAKDFMISVAQSCLGLLAADLINRISRVQRASELPPVAGYWMAALRDTRFGASLSERYLDQLAKAVPSLQLR